VKGSPGTLVVAADGTVKSGLLGLTMNQWLMVAGAVLVVAVLSGAFAVKSRRKGKAGAVANRRGRARRNYRGGRKVVRRGRRTRKNYGRRIRSWPQSYDTQKVVRIAGMRAKCHADGKVVVDDGYGGWSDIHSLTMTQQQSVRTRCRWH
jgi:hypothetical protein